jgi:colanic acid/amylovoran biosynthesis glycosyltransferase
VTAPTALNGHRVAHLVRRYGETSQTFIADAILEAERHGWEAWIVSKLPPANRDAFPYPSDDRILGLYEPPRWRRALGRVARRPPRERMASWWLPAVRRVQPDVLHVHFGWMGAEIGLARLRRPVVVSFHGSDVTAWPSRDPSHHALYADLFPEITCATVTSRFIERRLRGLGYGGPLEVLPPGVRLKDFPFREPDVSRSEARLLFVGRQVACKGLDVLLRALPQVPTPLPVTLDVIGDGSDRQANERLARGLGVDRRVRFHGAQQRKDVVSAMAAADVLVVPSRVTPAGEAEGSPVAPKEAFAVGLPVVATEVGGLPEVVPPEHRHELVRPDEPDALAAQIGELIVDRPNWPHRARIGRRFVEDMFDWAQLGKRTADIYERISMAPNLEEGGRRPVVAGQRRRARTML